MISFKLSAQLGQYLQGLRAQGKVVGFVPTMGALHDGHLSLVARSRQDNDITVCSIFVNPSQFNNAEDLKNYPRTIEKDLDLLLRAGCDVVFFPEPSEVYKDTIDYAFELGPIAEVMEGAYRPGHFSGVINVVKRLFDLVAPHRVYFGQKDFQQCLVVQQLIAHYQMPLTFCLCPTTREADGLAMSSRNLLLTPEERSQAPFIYQVLQQVQKEKKLLNPDDLRQWAILRFAQNPAFRLDYFEISDAQSLQPLHAWHDAQNSVACVAAWLGKVRLIDNILL